MEYGFRMVLVWGTTLGLMISARLLESWYRGVLISSSL